MTCCFTCLLLLPLFSRNTYNLRLSIVASYDLRVVNIFYSFCSQAAGTRAKWSLWLFPLQLKPFLLPPRQRPLNSRERNTIQMPHYRYWENNAKYHKTWLNWSLSERQFRRKPAKTFSLSKRICLRIHLNLRQHEPISSRYVNYALMITISQHHHYHLPKNVVSCSGFDKHPLSRNRVGRALFSCGNFCQIIQNNSPVVIFAK